jgi:predicted tellurium resistance membrane protein TerC
VPESFIGLLTSPEAWVAFATLVVLEVVLGVDNIVFISILAGRLPPERRQRARILGLALGVVARIALLLSIAWVMRLTTPLFAVAGHGFSVKSLILIAGGLFLIGKSTHEIHDRLEGDAEAPGAKARVVSFAGIVAQIVVIDVVFALDSVITAVGMVDEVPIMIGAVLVAVVVMMAGARRISDAVDRHPTLRMLALAFLVLIGVNLLAEGFGRSIPKGYTYFAMAFSVGVELLNLRHKSSALVGAGSPTP